MKKFLSLLLSAALILSSFSITGISVFAAEAGKGDIDGDGYATAADARTVYRAAASYVTLTEDQRLAADINDDGRATAADARMILRHSSMLDSISDGAPARRYIDEDRSESATHLVMWETSPAVVGESFSIVVSAENITGTEAGNLFFTYDINMLEFESIGIADGSTAAMTSGGNYSEGEISWAFLWLENCDEGAENICEITFRVLNEGDISLLCEVGTWTGSAAPDDVSAVFEASEGQHEEPDSIYVIGEWFNESDTYGTDSPYIDIFPVTYEDKLDLYVKGVNVNGFKSADFQFNFDTEYLEFLDIQNDPANEGTVDLAVGGNPQEGLATWSFALRDSYEWDELPICVLTFRIIHAGETEVSYTVNSWDGTDETPANGRIWFEICENQQEEWMDYFINGFYNESDTYDTDSPYIDIFPVTYEDKLDLFVTGHNIQGTESATIFFNFDIDYLEFVEISGLYDFDLAMGDVLPDNPSTASFVFMFSDSCPDDYLDICKITFRILQPGTTNVSYDCSDWDGTDAPANGFVSLSIEETAQPADTYLEINTEIVGDVLNVFVRGINVNGLEAADLVFNYDANYLEYIDISQSSEDFVFFGWNSSDGTVTATLMYSLSCTEDELDICVISFRILNYGDTSISYDISSWDGTATPENGSVDVTLTEAPYFDIYTEPDRNTLNLYVRGVNVNGVEASTLVFEYDSAYLEYISISKISSSFFMTTGGETEDGRISFLFIFLDSYTEENLDICKITFKILKSGDTSVDFDCSDWSGTVARPANGSVSFTIDEYHEYEAVVTPPTCTEVGYTTYTCSICGDSYVDDITPATDHELNHVEIPSTCKVPGVSYDICANCEETFNYTVLSLADHTFGEWQTVNASTCVVKGEQQRTCSVCSKTETRNLDYAAHTPETVKGYPATCTKTGLTDGSKCSVCGITLIAQQEIPMVDHELNHITNPSTCKVQGVSYDICANCGETFNYTILPLATHTFGEWQTATASTCIKKGELQRTCSVCGKTETRELDFIAHNYAEEVTAPTCTSDGYTTYTCSVCGDTYTDNKAPATGHDLKHVEVLSTCTVAGESYDVCKNCGEIFNRASLPLLDHFYGDWHVTKEPTYLNEGERAAECVKCGNIKTEVFEQLVASNEKIDEDTNISVSFTDNTFEGDIELNVTEEFDGQSFNILNNEKGNFKSALYDITLTQDGEKVQPNGKVLVRMPIPEGYNPDTVVIYYVTNDGTLEKLNSYCKDGYVYFETTHFSSYAIVDESEENPAFTLGDVNGDGKINASDARIALRASAQLQELKGKDLLAADMNKDGKISASDARIILRISAQLDSIENYL